MTAIWITSPESMPAGTVIAPYAVWPREAVAEPTVNAVDCPGIWAKPTRESRVVVMRTRANVVIERRCNDKSGSASPRDQLSVLQAPESRRRHPERDGHENLSR